MKNTAIALSSLRLISRSSLAARLPHFITLMKPRGTPKINMSAMWSCRIHRHSRLTTSQNPGFGGGLIYAAASPRTRSCRGVRIHLTLHQQGFGPHQVPNREACDGGYDEADDDGRSTCRPGPRVRCWFFRRLRLALRCSARSRFVHFESNRVARYCVCREKFQSMTSSILVTRVTYLA